MSNTEKNIGVLREELGLRLAYDEYLRDHRNPLKSFEQFAAGYLQHTAEVQRILANIADLPVGASLTLADIAHDGFGGMIVKRTRSGNATPTYVFQREFAHERSRWADGLAQAIEEVETYVNTGKLQEPDKIVGF